jgi:hypothetical protein
MPLIRYRVGWIGWPGLPGVSTHYFSTSVADFAAVRTFYNAIKDHFPNLLTFQFPTSYDIINETDGKLASTVATAPLTQVSSASAAQGYSAATGALVRWNTSAVINGNKVVGRTYLVPLAQQTYANTGTVSTTVTNAIQTAANAMLSSYGDGLKVWARPFKGRTNVPNKPDIPARAGSFATALSATVPTTAAVMRSRRI